MSSSNRVPDVRKLLDPNTTQPLPERIRAAEGLLAGIDPGNTDGKNAVLEVLAKLHAKLGSECVLNATERQGYFDVIKSHENMLARLRQDNPQYAAIQARIANLHLKLAENYKSDHTSDPNNGTAIDHYVKALEYFAIVPQSPEISKSHGVASFLYASCFQSRINEKDDDKNKFSTYTRIIAVYHEAARHLVRAIPLNHNDDVRRSLAMVNHNLGKCYLALCSLSDNAAYRTDGERFLLDARQLFNDISQRTDKDAAAMSDIQRMLLRRSVYTSPAAQHTFVACAQPSTQKYHAVKHSPARRPIQFTTRSQEPLQNAAFDRLLSLIPKISETLNDPGITTVGVLQDSLKCYLFLLCLGINQYLWPYKYYREFIPVLDTIRQLRDIIFVDPAINVAGITGALTAFLNRYTCASLEEKFQAIIQNTEHRNAFQALLQSIVQGITVPGPLPVPPWQHELQQIGLCLHEIVDYATLDNMPPELVAHALAAKIKVVVAIYEKLPVAITDNLGMLLRNYSLNSLLFDAYRSFADHFYIDTCIKHLSDLLPDGRLFKEIRAQSTNLRNAATELQSHPEAYGFKLNIKRR